MGRNVFRKPSEALKKVRLEHMLKIESIESYEAGKLCRSQNRLAKKVEEDPVARLRANLAVSPSAAIQGPSFG